jgi:hypothetical protein
VIAAGVLLALAADSWREGQVDRRLEEEYIFRLRSDLEAEVARLKDARIGIERKLEPLERLVQLDPAERDLDFAQIAADLVGGGNWLVVWGSPVSAAYDDMLGSGRFSLIEDPSLRSSIVHYYRNYESWGRSIEARATGFDGLKMQLVRQSDFGLSAAASEAIVGTPAGEHLSSLLDPATVLEIKRVSLAEVNLVNFVLPRLDSLVGLAEALLEMTESAG